MSWGMGSGVRVAVTTKTWSTLAAMGRTPRPSGTRRSSTVRRGSTPTMRVQLAAGLGLQPDPSPTTTLERVALDLAAEDGSNLAVRR